MSIYQSLTNGVVGQYGKYQTYPVGSQEDDLEGAYKIFSTLSSPNDVFQRAVVGLNRIVGVDILNDINNPRYLERIVASVYTTFEQVFSTSLSPRLVKETFDGTPTRKESSNCWYTKLSFWPVTHIEAVLVAFPHGESTNPTFQYVIPPHWVALKDGVISIVPDFGFFPNAITGMVLNGRSYPIFKNFRNTIFNPSEFIVQYKYGFSYDQIPANLAEYLDLKCMSAIIREMAAVLLPTNSVTTSIDAVSQSASTKGSDLLLQKADMLDARANEIEKAITGSHASSISLSFIGG